MQETGIYTGLPLSLLFPLSTGGRDLHIVNGSFCQCPKEDEAINHFTGQKFVWQETTG
jgi:hypothetical protein